MSQNRENNSHIVVHCVTTQPARGTRDTPFGNKITTEGDHGLSDETILDRLAGTNAELRAQLKQLLGSDDFEKPSSTNNPGPSTKH